MEGKEEEEGENKSRNRRKGVKEGGKGNRRGEKEINGKKREMEIF